MATEISNMDDVIDSRDVIARIEHLEQLRQPGPVDLGPEDSACDQDSLFHELKTLEAFMAQMCDQGGDEEWRGDWYPVTCIRDSYFKDYAQELAEDLGTINSDVHWPYTCIDWDRAARELRMDYTAVEFDGVTYWVR